MTTTTTDVRVEAIRDDKVIGRGTCSSIDECMGDEEIVAALDAEKIETPASAVRWARKSERAWLDRMLDARWGEDSDDELKISRDFDRRCEEDPIPNEEE
jgi:hypothetical protein